MDYLINMSKKEIIRKFKTFSAEVIIDFANELQEREKKLESLTKIIPGNKFDEWFSYGFKNMREAIILAREFDSDIQWINTRRMKLKEIQIIILKIAAEKIRSRL